jgi:hypothetical protein
MVIFGAGASYDSLARGPSGEYGSVWRPPLANELFDPRWGPYITLFPQAASLITDLEKPGTNVEGELEKFQNDTEQYARLRVPLTAIRYYLQSMLSSCQSRWGLETRHVTNYNPLLLQIDRWVKVEKVLVSFNYDTLLEEALDSTLGIRFDSMGDYVTGNYKVIKPHGSINWWHSVDSPKFPSPTSIPEDRVPMVIARAQELKISPVFELSTPTRAILPGIPTIPALALPVATKSEYECPDDHQKVLAQSFQNVTKVLVIGWRATENRFLKSFAQGIGRNRPQFLVVSRNEESAVQVEQMIKDRLRENGASAEYSHLPYGFSAAIKNHDFDSFLKS